MNQEKTASGGDFVRDLGEAIRDNPIPAALIGMGLAWLLTAGRSSAKAGFGWARDSVTRFGSKKRAERRAISATRLTASPERTGAMVVP